MGFSADWLTLREPVDHAARDKALLRAALEAAGPAPVILDLGCGTGSTVRALAPHLPEGTQWRLVDNDEALLEHARAGLDGRASVHCLDIHSLDQLPLDGVTLVTASALLDLVSKEWLIELGALIRVPLYLALTYNGSMQWTPEDPRDDSVTEAFNRHQRSEKGIGAALGPDAADVAATLLADASFDVSVGQSPWRLGPEHAPLHRALLEGIAQAADEAGESSALAWGATRDAAAEHSSCTIGHTDILAIPGADTEKESDV